MVVLYHFCPGGEEGRTGWSASDPSRQRVSGPAINAGSLSKQKNPVANESAVGRDAMVSPFWFDNNYTCSG